MKVLLIPADFHHAEGVMAKNISANCPDVEFYYFSAHDIQRREKEFLSILSSVDVVHWLMNLCNVPHVAKLTSNDFPCPSVATVHHLSAGEEKKVVFAQYCDVIHVESKQWLEWFKERKIETPVVLAHNGVDLELFFDNRQVNRPSTPFRIGTFGFYRSFSGRKRFDILVGALVELKTRKYDFQLVLQGPKWNRFTDILVEYGISVMDLGLVPMKDSWKGYGEIDCYVCSSDVEGGPLPVLEALASGVPVISTAVGLSKEAIAIGGGILCRSGNPTDIADALEKLINDVNLYQKFAQESVSIAEYFSWKRVGVEYKQLYLATIEEWERKQNREWERESQSFYNAKQQQSKELAHDLIRECWQLEREGQYFQGLLLVCKAVLKKQLPLHMKLTNLLKYLASPVSSIKSNFTS